VDSATSRFNPSIPTKFTSLLIAGMTYQWVTTPIKYGDKVRLKQRLKDAIANSKAIANLVDNPLLLTMMAILNRRQELPRDRADLYAQAARGSGCAGVTLPLGCGSQALADPDGCDWAAGKAGDAAPDCP
jgi:hypothetical protein